MKSTMTTSLGIDITESEIRATLLRRTHVGFRVVGTACASLPDGTTESGRVVDSTGLAKALRMAKECRRRPGYTALSLPSDGVLTRVVSLAEEDPQEIARFVEEEVGQYATFSGRRTARDFRVVAGAKKNVPGKAVVAAADHTAMETLTCACRSAGIDAGVVEPAIIACLRIFRVAKSRERLGPNVLLALLKDGVLTLAVLQKNALDFIRSRRIASVEGDSVERYNRVIDEINAILRFYTVKATAIPSVVFVNDENDLVPIETEQAVKCQVTSDTVDVWTRGNVSEHLAVEPGIGAKGSITSLGLAMRSLVDEPKGAEVNLLTNVADRTMAIQRNVVLGAISLAVLVLVVILVTGGIEHLVGRMQHDIAAMGQSELDRGGYSLPMAVEQLSEVEEQIAATSNELACLAYARQLHLDLDWAQLLNDVRAAVPRDVRLTELTVENTGGVKIEGVSESNAGIAGLVSMLNRSNLIAQAELLEASRYNGEDARIRYSITCNLASEEIR